MGAHAEDVRRKALERSGVSALAAAVEAIRTANAPSWARMSAAFEQAISEQDVIEAVSRLVDAYPRLRKVHAEIETLLRTALVRDVIEEEIGGEPRHVLGPDEIMDADELLAEARAGGEVRRHILQEEMLDAAAVSRLLGSQSVNPRQYANNLRRRAALIGLRHRNQFLYPAFQFDRDRGRVDPVVAEINQLLAADDDPWGVASWWLSTNDRLGGQAPKDALQDPEARSRLVTIAQSLTEPLG